MITGVVTSFHQAIIRLIVRGPTGQAQEIKAVIDTGCDGALSLMRDQTLFVRCLPIASLVKTTHKQYNEPQIFFPPRSPGGLS
jgi:hypothetical protein